MELIRSLDEEELLKYKEKNDKTIHMEYRFWRKKPMSKIRYGFEIDRNHVNGREIHIIDDDAYIFIYNKESMKLITILIARVGQIKRYGIVDEDMIEKAYKNYLNGMNN